MPTITLTDPVAGTTVASGLIATNNSNLRNLLNSGLDPVNLKGNPSLTANDVPVWNGTNFVRPTGTASASTYLRGDGTWTNAPAELIGVAQGAALDVSFTGGVYKWLKIIGSTHGSPAASYTSYMRLNGDSTSTYDWHYIGGATVATNLSDLAASATNGGLIAQGDSNYAPSSFEVDIPEASYTAVVGRNWLGKFIYSNSSVGTAGRLVVAHGGGIYYGGTGAITRVQVFSAGVSYAAQTEIKLYGFR